MDFFARRRASKMRIVIGDWLPGSRPGKKSQEYTQVLSSGDDFLDSHAGDMDICEMNSHIGISLVGTDYKLTCLCYCEVDSGDSDFGLQKFLSQMQSGRMSQVGRVFISFFGLKFFMEKI